MYRYYPSSSLDVTFASLYELGLESETESLIPSIDEKSQPCRCFLYYVLVFNARFFTRGRESVRSEVEIEIVFTTIIVEKVEV